MKAQLSETNTADREILQSVHSALERARSSLALHEGPLSLVVGVSGGEDSLALFDILSKLSHSLPLTLRAAHVNHGLRAESDEEEDFVSSLLREYRFELSVFRAPERPPEQNMESWARRIRYRFFEELRRETDAHFVVTAHHQADQVETVLWRILTGRFANSAHGIAELDVERKLLRPFLQTPKAAIEQYRRLHRLSFVYDKSNDDLSRSRNLIRHKVLPWLRKDFNPGISRNLLQTLERVGQDERYVCGEAQRLYQRESKPFQVEYLRSLPPAIAWRVLLLIAKDDVGPRAESLGYEALARVLQNLLRLGQNVIHLDLGYGISCVLDLQVGVRFCETSSRARKRIKAECGECSVVDLVIPGDVTREYADGSRALLGAQLITSSEQSYEGLLAKARAEVGNAYTTAKAYFDAAELEGEILSVRERLDGDTLDVWKRGRRKLKKLFQEKAIVLTLRDRIPIVELGTTILWVPGVARSNVAPISENSEVFVELSYRRGAPGGLGHTGGI